jgi:transcriptional regulator with XRE-family HTH domain
MSEISTNQVWYEQLVKDCLKIKETGKMLTGVALIRHAWEMGNRILPDYEKFGRHERGNKTQQDLADDIGVGRPRISEYIAVRNKIGEDFDRWIKTVAGATLSSYWKFLRDFLPKNPRSLEHKSLKELIEENISELSKEQLRQLLQSIRGCSTFLEAIGISKIREIEEQVAWIYNN